MGIYQLYLGGRPTIGRYVNSIWWYPNARPVPASINIDGGTLTVQNAYLGDYYGGTVSQSGGMVNIGSFYLGNNVLPITQQAQYNISGGTLNCGYMYNGPSGGTISSFSTLAIGSGLTGIGNATFNQTGGQVYTSSVLLGSAIHATAGNVYTYNLTGGTLYANGISFNTYGQNQVNFNGGTWATINNGYSMGNSTLTNALLVGAGGLNLYTGGTQPGSTYAMTTYNLGHGGTVSPDGGVTIGGGGYALHAGHQHLHRPHRGQQRYAGHRASNPTALPGYNTYGTISVLNNSTLCFAVQNGTQSNSWTDTAAYITAATNILWGPNSSLGFDTSWSPDTTGGTATTFTLNGLPRLSGRRHGRRSNPNIGLAKRGNGTMIFSSRFQDRDLYGTHDHPGRHLAVFRDGQPGPRHVPGLRRRLPAVQRQHRRHHGQPQR